MAGRPISVKAATLVFPVQMPAMGAAHGGYSSPRCPKVAPMIRGPEARHTTHQT